MADIEDFECSIELPIGIKFYFWDHLYEVAELEDEIWGCSKCALLDDFFNNPLYQVCELQQNERRDEKLIFLEKELNKIRKNNNGRINE